jgi:hypothetical protein
VAETPESDKKPNNQQKPGELPSPKRGALPTPRAEIEKAKPYIPEIDRADDQSATQPVSPENADPQERKPMPVQSPKRGAIPSPRSALAAAIPHAAVVGAPPNFITVPAHISMWGNDVHGDCVTAEEAFAKACNTPEIFIPDSDVISWATRHGVLEGANIVQVLQWMQNDGFQQGSLSYDDGPYFSVNWTNSATLQSAISCGPVKIGVAADQLETAWRTTGGQTGWFAIGFHADSNEDHCPSLCGYGTINWLAQQLHVQVPAGIDGTKTGYGLFTWNSIGIIDDPSLLAITQEAWLRQPTTVTKAPGIGTLAFVKTSNTPSGHVEVHLASGTSGYQSRILETATTFANESDGVWQLLLNLDLAFIKTSNTPSGRVEVHIASRMSNYQSRILETATTFANESDGVWQLLPNLDLVFIKTSNTPSGRVEVHIASRVSNYQSRILETATTFADESDGVWQLLPNLDLVFIKTSNTPDGHVEVHIASRASNYQTRTLEIATTFLNESDGTWSLLLP